MSKFSPLVKCLNPKKIVNPYTNQTLFVPCGHCVACACNKSNHFIQLLQMEDESHKFCAFITLTYAPKYLPMAQFVDNLQGINQYSLIDPKTSECLADVTLNPAKLEMLQKKFNLDGNIPYLRKDDFQKFMKRLRYYVCKRTNEKLRYFGCGEYGPVHFRPHYHLLLFFSNQETLQILEQSVLQSWPFGRCDVQLSKGKTSSYVAGYVNSTVSLPEILKNDAVRPFVVHSQKLGCRFRESEREKVYSISPREVVKRSLIIDGKYKEFIMPVSYSSYFFPKCKGYAIRTKRERAYAYGLYYAAQREIPIFTSCFDLAKQVAELSYLFGKTKAIIPKDVSLIELLQYFYDPMVDYQNKKEYSRYIHRIYIELLVSKHFLLFVCDHKPHQMPTTFEIQRKLKMIDEFYSQLDYLNLVSFFENQQTFLATDLIGAEDLQEWRDDSFYPYFYDNVDFKMEDYYSCPAYMIYAAEVTKLAEDKIKHKVLNDKNRIFL